MANKLDWVIWRFLDGKPGHENQSQGLVDALAQRIAVKVYDLHALTKSNLISGFFNKRAFGKLAYDDPCLCLGAGHRTHFSILSAGHRYRAKTVVLMKPSLPMSWFDLCLIPEHDGVRNRSNCILTQGVLNRVKFHQNRDLSRGLILLGGPSRHYQWSNEKILTQLRVILARQAIHWTIATSRRTPDNLLPALAELKATTPNEALAVIYHDQVNQDWLPAMLDLVGMIWVSTDSVSMVYEGLSSGAACGLLTLEPSGTNRVTTGLKNLVARRQITSFDQWQNGRVLTVPEPAFSEASRCADEIINRFQAIT